MPTTGMARVEGQTTVDQCERDIDVLAPICEQKAGKCENVGVVRTAPKRPPRKIDTGAPGRFRVFGPAVDLKPPVTMGRQGESRTESSAVRSFVGRSARRRVSATSKVGSITPATLIATLS